MPKERIDYTTDPDGDESHPAFGMVSFNRVHATPGEVLFQSDVRHPEYVVIRVHEATRRRDLHHDWVHAERKVLEISMSMAQFASFVASAGTEGVPATIDYVGTGKHGAGERPGLKPASRLARTTGEVRDAAAMAYAAIADAFAKYEEAVGMSGAGSAATKKTALRNLKAAITNAVPNVTYATRRLDEHAESVMEKSRADVEAMVTRMAERYGLSLDEVRSIESGLEAPERCRCPQAASWGAGRTPPGHHWHSTGQGGYLAHDAGYELEEVKDGDG